MTVIERVVERVQRVSPITADAAIGAWILAIGSLELVLGWNYLPGYPPAAVGLLTVATLGVTLRRTKPWAAFALVSLASIGGLITHASFFGPLLALLVVLYTVSERTDAVGSLLALLLAFVAHYLAMVPLGMGLTDIPSLFLADFAWIGLAWFAGRTQARRRRIASDLGRAIDELQDERDQLARSAVTIERGRIARELQAMVLRGLERMNAKTSASRRCLVSDARQASWTIAEIEATGRRTLVEMRRLLGVLRTRNGDVRWSEAGPLPRRASPGPTASDDPLLGYPPSVGHQPDSASRITQQAIRETAPWVTDALIVLVMAIMAVAEKVIYPPADARYILTAVAVVGALAFRRIAPIVVLAVIAAVILPWNLFTGGDPFTADRALFVAIFTVAALRGPRWGAVAIGVQVAVYAPLLRLHGGVPWQLAWSSQMAFAVIAGLAVREGHRLTKELQEQTDTLRRTREERIRLAVYEERFRIARDVHDLVAHGVTLMVIQAGAARWLAEGDPRRADQALDSVQRAGRDAHRELHALVGSLGTSALHGAEPLPADEDLTIPLLVDHAIGSGMNVELVIRGDPRELDGGLELSLYRIVQEALTNVRKHAPGARTSVELRYTPEGVEVEVTDTGGRTPNGSPPTVPGSGQGLVGIAERARLFGGQAEAGPTKEGWFRVRASLAEERVPV